MENINVCLVGGGLKEAILREALDALGQDSPHVLIVPSACSTENSYNKKVSPTVELFERLGVTQTVLHEFNASPTPTEREQNFGQAAMIYTIGGNTPYLLRTLRQHNTFDGIRAAAQTGTMLAGVSAGALLPFRHGHSDKSAKRNVTDFDLVDGLDLIPATGGVHANIIPADMDKPRLHDLLDRLPLNQEPALAFENGAALLSHDGTHRIVRSAENAAVHFASTVGEIACRPVEDDADMTAIMREIYAQS